MKMSKKNKKGVSLVYVILASAVLMIISGALAASASNNINLTARSTEGRQSYITARSAMEYAKGVVNEQIQEAQEKLDKNSTLHPADLINKSDAFHEFFVKPNDSVAAKLQQVNTAGATLDGTHYYAQCEITNPDNTKYNYTAAISVMVMYNNHFSKVLNFTKSFSLKYTVPPDTPPVTPPDTPPVTPPVTPTPADVKGIPFLVLGGRYGYKSLIDSNGGTDEPSFNDGASKSGWAGMCTNGDSAYPLVFVDPVKAEAGYCATRHVKAPQIFFMATQFGKYSKVTNNSWEKNNCSFYAEENHANVTLVSDFIYIAGQTVRGKDSADEIVLKNYTNDSSKAGIICLAQDFQVQVAQDNAGADARTIGNITIPAGYYYFQNGTNLFDSSTLSWIKMHPVASSDVAKVAQDNNVDYVKNQYEKLCSANDTAYSRWASAWTQDGCIENMGSSDSRLDQSGKDVYMYVERNNSKTPGDGPLWNKWGTDEAVYKANYLALLYVTNGDNPDNCPFVVGKKVTFQVGNSISISGQKLDGNGDEYDKFVLKPDFCGGKLILTSASDSDVTVVLRHTLVVKDSAGNVLYTKGAGTYTVPTGTDILSGDKFTSGGGTES